MSQMDSLAASTLEELPLNVAVLDADGDILFTNRAWREFGGETDAAPEGVNYFAAIDATDDVYAARAVTGLESVIDGRRDVFTLEYPCHTPEAKQWFLMRATRVSGGEPPRILVVHVDVTDRKLAELAARRRSADLRRERRNLEHLLDRINGLLGDVTEVLVAARSREAVEAQTCEAVAAADPFVAAWIARRDLSGDTLTVAAWAGRTADETDGRTLPMAGDHPAVRAVETGSLQVVDDLAGTTDELDARPRDARSLVAVPLVHREECYGVLVVYADRPGAFDDREREVLTALGRTLANAVRALEHKKLLAADTAVELEVETGDPALFFVDLSGRLDGEIRYEGSVYREDGSLLVFFALPPGAGATAVAVGREHPTVEDAAVVSEGESQSLVEFTVADSLVERLADAGGAVREISAEGGRARIRAEFPDQAAARSAFEALRDTHGADLCRYRERERPARTGPEFRDELAAELTDRQLAVLQRAYVAGFFEWPRPVTGEDLADAMGIARSTFHQHLRAAERKLLDAFFEP